MVNEKDNSFENLIKSSNIYLKEADKCAQSGCYLAAHIMLGSTLEAILKSYLIAFSDMKEQELQRVSLFDLIEIFNGTSWFKKAMVKRAQILRQLRNTVHPNRLTKEKLKVLNRKRGWESTEKKFDKLMDYFESIL